MSNKNDRKSKRVRTVEAVQRELKTFDYELEVEVLSPTVLTGGTGFIKLYRSHLDDSFDAAIVYYLLTEEKLIPREVIALTHILQSAEIFHQAIVFDTSAESVPRELYEASKWPIPILELRTITNEERENFSLDFSLKRNNSKEARLFLKHLRKQKKSLLGKKGIEPSEPGKK